MLWKQEVEFNVLQYSKFHIHGEVVMGNRDKNLASLEYTEIQRLRGKQKHGIY